MLRNRSFKTFQMLHVFSDKEQLSQCAARLFVQAAQEAVAQQGRFVVALTGGSSPKRLYELLAQPPYLGQVPWSQTFVFWGDERWVPLTDDQSNYKMASEALLGKVPVPPNQVFPMWQDGISAEAYAAVYEQQLCSLFEGQQPRFDLVLLGMGDDGHTASLFPGTAVLHQTEKLVDAYYLQSQSMFRITLTAPLINTSKQIVFMTFGKAKAKALFEVLEGDPNPMQYPSQLIRKDAATVHWLTDTEATGLLQQPYTVA